MEKYNSFLGYKHIHFVGVGGISMSGLAKLCLHMGIKVSGSDKTKSHITEELVHLGADIFYKHQKSNIAGAELVVYTCAVGENNAEVVFARQQGLPVFERAEFLGKIAKNYKNVIAVAGSHGKTTVCGMLFKIFEAAEKRPTLLVGGEAGSNNNLIIGDNDILIVEACEYREHFLKIGHTAGVVLNIDYDHPDYFKTEKDYEKSFEKFILQSKMVNFIDEKYSIVFGNKTVRIGDGGYYQAKRVRHGEGRIEFDTYKAGKFFCHIVLNVIGSHNVKNALFAVAVADYFGVDKCFIKKGLLEFESLKRRYEFMGKLNDNIVITDYAHHPTQIENAIKATKEIYTRQITVVFEPHTYSRTKFLFNDFVSSLSLADNIILLPTYSAREKSKRGGTSRDLFEALKFKKQKVLFAKSYKKCYKELQKLKNNIILILGAGSVIKLAEQIKMQYIND